MAEAETYPDGWKRVSVMISPDGNNVHHVEGDMKAWRKLHDRIYGEPKSTGTAMPTDMPDLPFNPEDEPPYFRNG